MRATERRLGQADQYAELVRVPAMADYLRYDHPQLHPNHLDEMLGRGRQYDPLLCGFILRRVGVPLTDPFIGPRTLVQAALFGAMDAASIVWAARAAIASMGTK